MDDKWIYDLTNDESALKSLRKFINVGEREIVKFIALNLKEGDYSKVQSDMLDNFNIELENLIIDDIEIKSIHITTGNDNGRFILENGLYNLQRVLTNDTPIKRFLEEEEIEIDVSNKVINYKGRNIRIVDDTGMGGCQRNLVHHKLYKDYAINGFVCDEKPLKYGGEVAYRPEFIRSLGKFLKEDSLENQWEKTFNQCYIVEFKTSLNKLDYSTFQMDGLSKEEIEINKSKYIKIWLIIKSIEVIACALQGASKPQIFAYLDSNENIPKEDIINVIDATEERDSLR